MAHAMAVGGVAVIDDGTGAEVLTNALARLGFDVDYYPENYQVVRYVNPASSQSEIRYSVRHSWDDALVFKYDAVVAVLTGAAGTGRLLIDPEAKAYADFVERGGRVFLAGNAPLSRPDNLQAAELLGLAESACSPVAVAEAQARAAAGTGRASRSRARVLWSSFEFVWGLDVSVVCTLFEQTAAAR